MTPQKLQPELRLPAFRGSAGAAMDASPHTQLARGLISRDEGTSQRLQAIHQIIQSRYPFVERIALALYDPQTDLLKTFASSQTVGERLKHYEARLQDVPSLLALANNRQLRVIDDIEESLRTPSAHTQWLRAQSFRSSYTLPIFAGEELAAFLFFDSREPGTFTEDVTRFLEVFADLAAQLFLFKLNVVRNLVSTIHIANRIASLRDVETGTHLERMAKISRLIGCNLAALGVTLDDEFIEYVHLFAPLHDIGKVGVPDRILFKPGPLDAEERALMQQHVQIGEGMIKHIVTDIGIVTDTTAAIMRNVVSGHHERCDGSGYPRGLKGEQIPLEARIVAVADVFDALSTARPYKPAWSLERCIAQVEQEAADGKLDPMCVRALLANIPALAAIRDNFRDDV